LPSKASSRRAPSRSPTISLRAVEPTDEAFLRRLYASTREAELSLVDWDAEQKAAFVDHQFAAQRRDYLEHYPAATHDVIVVDGEAAGRLWVDRCPREIRVVDISLLPAFRGRGVGTSLLRELQAEAAASNRALSIHVERFNPASRLYARLGFAAVDAGDVYVLMRWTPVK
jgi:GNAT superfamily N-acetyltransferase